MVEPKDMSREKWQHLSDEEPATVQMDYEGNRIPFFIVIAWIGMVIGIAAYVWTLLVPDAIDWWGS